HFFEQNVHWHFLKILQSKNDGALIVQVLQTLNIMFENVRSRESLYFLLSNNYVNQVIGLRYDFSNDEILAYYIYLLRTLSFKLSKDTIYFFFNEHLDDFPLYSEAIKFFNHEESMIRIAVRVITLNVYSVNDKKMQDFILDRTTTTYFSNLVWFIGNYGTTVNDMLLHPGEGEFSRMNYYLAEHMDCFYYVNDIIELDVPKINKILISNLLNRLLRPMYLDSLLTASASASSNNKTTSTSKLLPLVALSLMLHAFHVLKHAPLVSALTSTLFSNQHFSQNTPTPHRPTPLPLMLGQQSVSPESSRPASPQQQQQQHEQHQQQQQQQQEHYQGSLGSNPYKISIFEFLAHTDNDRLVLPAMALIYLTGRNPGVMPDVLLGTDVYPQRLLKSRLLMGNLTSSAPNSRPGYGGTLMSREKSSDSIMSISSNGGGGGVAIRTFGTQGTIGGSLFGGAGASRMRTRTESPLFETEEDEECRETEELLASEAPTPTSEFDAVGPLSLPRSSGHPSSSAHLSSSVPTPISRPMENEIPAAPVSEGAKSRSKSRRRSSRASSILGPILPSSSSMGEIRSDSEFGQELRPVFTAKEDRVSGSTYQDNIQFSDEESVDHDKDKDKEDIDDPPPLPPRRLFQEVDTDDDQTAAPSIHEHVGPVIQTRDELIDRLVDIICGQAESGAHRFRILTIQMATELLIEFVYTKGGNGKEPSGPHHQGGESQLGEGRLQRLALAEALFRDRVKKGIIEMEKRKIAVSPVLMDADKRASLLSTFTVKAERSLNESKLGIDRQIVNMISESSIIYGPDKEQESDPDLDPDPDLVVLFELDPEFVGPVTYEKPSLTHDSDEVTNLDRASITNGSSSTTAVGGRGVRIRNRIKAKMQGHTPPTSGKQPPTEPRKPQLTALQRLEAMVVRYIKWLHILIQCRQLLCKKPITPFSKAVEASSPAISVTESPTLPHLLGRRPSDLMMGASIGGGGGGGGGGASAGSGSGTGTGTGAASAHRGLQKALATTATTTSAAPVTVSLLSASLASSPATSAVNSDSTVSTSNSSVSSMTSSPSNMVPASVSATLSQPGSISASGDTGSRALLTATAALEAAAGSGTLGHHLGPLGSASATLSSHLDPLSASVTEAIRKSGAKIKTMVDPLTGNHLFRVSSYHDPNKDSSESSSAASSVMSLGRPFGSTTAASAVVHGGMGMQRTLSGASHASNQSVGVDSEAVVERVDVEVLTGEDGETNTGDDVFKSILDPTHPAHQSEDPLLKVLETLGLVDK
ncbi:Protein CL16A, partial [Podila minutissima]